MKFPTGPWRALLFAAIASAGSAEEPDPFTGGQRRDIAGSSSVSSAPLAGELLPIPAMEGDEEFGETVIVERTSNWYPIAIQAAVSGYRTNNAELASDGGQTDNYLRSLVAASYTPAIKGNLFADIGVFEESYRYDRLGELDFDYLRGHGGLFYYLPPEEVPLSAIFGNGFLFANYSYYRVSDGLFGPGVFSNHSAILGFQKAFPLLKGHQAYYGLATDLSLSASDDEFQRNEYRAYAGYLVEWTENLRTQAGYVGTRFDYRDSDQGDWNHVVEAVAAWVLARPVIFGAEAEVYVEADANFTLNDSNVAGFDYDYFTWGGGFGFRTSF